MVAIVYLRLQENSNDKINMKKIPRFLLLAETDASTFSNKTLCYQLLSVSKVLMWEAWFQLKHYWEVEESLGARALWYKQWYAYITVVWWLWLFWEYSQKRYGWVKLNSIFRLLRNCVQISIVILLVYILTINTEFLFPTASPALFFLCVCVFSQRHSGWSKMQ